MRRQRVLRIASTAACALAVTTFAATAEAAPSQDETTRTSTACATSVEHPDLGVMRFRDPACRRALWLGAETAGVAVPASVGLADQTLWVLRGAGTWSMRLAPWASVGGRHGGTMFSMGTARLGVREHRLETAFHPWSTRRAGLHDRLVVGIESHTLGRAYFDGVEFRPGGVRDFVAALGYGADHSVAKRWSLGWQVQGRHAWLYRSTQRQLHVGLRVAVTPRPAHRLEATPSLFVIHRDADQGGRRLPRLTSNLQVAASYSWMSRVGVGVFVGGRYTSAFLTGEAPMYELRSESLQQHYVEGQVGLRAVWR